MQACLYNRPWRRDFSSRFYEDSKKRQQNYKTYVTEREQFSIYLNLRPKLSGTVALSPSDAPEPLGKGAAPARRGVVSAELKGGPSPDPLAALCWYPVPVLELGHLPFIWALLPDASCVDLTAQADLHKWGVGRVCPLPITTPPGTWCGH